MSLVTRKKKKKKKKIRVNLPLLLLLIELFPVQLDFVNYFKKVFLHVSLGIWNIKINTFFINLVLGRADHISRLYNAATSQLYNQGILKAIFIDLEKASDMVWHDGLYTH